jgi:hypothetical protein
MKHILMATVFLAAAAAQSGGWNTLFDGKSLDGWDAVGDANWKLAGGIVEATTGTGFLVSKASYKDYDLKVEVWVDEPANSGVFIRCINPKEIAADKGYEVNIYDTRPEQKYATGAIVNVAAQIAPVKAAGKWNTLEISARGSRFTVKLNGAVTSEGTDTKFPDGRIALQHGAGVVRFRNVQIRPL